MLCHQIHTRRLLVAIGVGAAVLTACTIGSFRVENPPVLLPIAANSCPKLAGTYAGRGTRTTVLGGGDCWIQPCDDLMAQFTPRGSVEMIPPALPDKPPSFVRVSQPDDATVELTEWTDLEMKTNPVASARLSSASGDFSCKDGMLELASTKHALVLLFANAVITESHAFGRALNGALVMRRMNVGLGHILTVPNEAYKVEEWVVWSAHEPKP